MFRSSLDLASPTTPYRGGDGWGAGCEHEEEAKLPPGVDAT